MNKPASLGQLKQNIRAKIANLSQDLLNCIMENAIKRAQICQCLNRVHLSNIIFKTSCKKMIRIKFSFIANTLYISKSNKKFYEKQINTKNNQN